MDDKYTLASLPEEIPLFPLSGVILLPRIHLPLNIFEPRYLVMFDDLLKSSNRLVGIIQPVSDADGDDEGLHQVGCAGRVTGFSESSDGRYLVALTGVSRFRLVGIQPGFTPYKKGQIEWSEFEADLGEAERDSNFDRAKFVGLLFEFMEINDGTYGVSKLQSVDVETIVNTMAMAARFDSNEKQALLESRTLQERREALEILMRMAIGKGPHQQTLQ